MPRGSDLGALEWLGRAAAGGDETARADAHGGEQQTPDLFVHAKMAARHRPPNRRRGTPIADSSGTGVAITRAVMAHVFGSFLPGDRNSAGHPESPNRNFFQESSLAKDEHKENMVHPYGTVHPQTR